jgi:hypothetical protein
MNRKFKASFIAISMALAATSAHAASTSSASLGPVSYQLFDLNPLDSVAPTITWSTPPDGYGNYTYANAYDNAAVNNQSTWAYGTNGFSNNASGVATALSAAQSSITSGGVVTSPTGVSLSANGHANGTTGVAASDYSYYQAGSYAPYYYYYNGFTLGANTAVVFTANATASASTSVGYQDGYGGEYANAYAWLNVWGSQPSGNGGNQSSYSEVRANASYTSTWNEQTYQYFGQETFSSDTLSGAYVNLTGAEKIGNVQFGTQVDGISYVAAVPEPGTYAMLLAGLGLMGAIARRRKVKPV